jgi:hypothetical protein
MSDDQNRTNAQSTGNHTPYETSDKDQQQQNQPNDASQQSSGSDATNSSGSSGSEPERTGEGTGARAGEYS